MIFKKQINFLNICSLTSFTTVAAAAFLLPVLAFAANNSPKMTEEQYLREQAIRKSQMYQNFIQQHNTAQVSYQPQQSINSVNATALSGNEINPLEAAQPIQSQQPLYQNEPQNAAATNNGNRIVNCWDEASKVYGVDPWLIFAYAKTESSFKPWATNGNSNSSIDRGLMQINSTWLPTLAKYNIRTEHLFDSCVSIFVGTWIIRQNINRYGYNYHGLVAYNVGNPFNPRTEAVARRYYTKLNENYQALTRAYRR